LWVSPAKAATATLRRPLGLCGYRLGSKRSKTAAARDAITYRVVLEALPKGGSIEHLEGAWREQLAGSSTGRCARFPLQIKGEILPIESRPIRQPSRSLQGGGNRDRHPPAARDSVGFSSQSWPSYSVNS
jgi:hypothetical protein